MSAELKIKISGDGSGFAATLDKAKSQASGFASHLAGDVGNGFSKSFLGIIPGVQHAIANIFDPSAIIEKFNERLHRAKDIKLGAIRTQMDTDSFQRLNNALESVGLDAGTATMAIGKLASAQEAVANGSVDGTKNTVKLAEAMASIGVSLEDIQKKSPQQLFQQIANSMQGAAAEGKVSGEQLSALREMFGKSALELLPVFAKGTEGSLADVGNIDEKEIKKLSAIGKQWKEFKAILGDASDAPARWTGAAFDWMINNPLSKKVDELGGIRFADDANGDAATKRNAAKILARDQEKARKQAEALAELGESKAAAKVEKEVDEQRKKNAMAAATPEQKRAVLLDEIAKREREIAEIRAYADAGSYSSAEARTMVAKEELEIEKTRGELAQLDKSKNPTERGTRATDRLTQIGLDVSSVPVRREDKAAAFYEQQRLLHAKWLPVIGNSLIELKRINKETSDNLA